MPRLDTARVETSALQRVQAATQVTPVGTLPSKHEQTLCNTIRGHAGSYHVVNVLGHLLRPASRAGAVGKQVILILPSR